MHVLDLNRTVLVRVGMISQARGRMEDLKAYLGEADRARQGRFRFQEDRERLILGRAILGRCLEEFVGLPAGAALELDFSAQGRPLLRGREDVEFSVSHSGEVVAVALTRGAGVGVDVQLMAEELDFPALAERMMGARELGDFQATIAGERRAAFFQAWTAKEAWLKARGVGIAEGMEGIPVPLKKSVSPRRLETEGEWWVQGLLLPEGYLGNVVWQGAGKELDFGEMRF